MTLAKATKRATIEGKLLLDLRNKNNDGLDKDVDTP